MSFDLNLKNESKGFFPNSVETQFALALILGIFAYSSSCSQIQAASHGYSRSREGKQVDDEICSCSEVVMKQGTTISATTSVGTIQITADTPLKRTYTWEGASRSVKMKRRVYRWYGSCGLYFPGAGYHWKEHHGIRRGVLEEGQQRFDTAEEAAVWLKKKNNENAMVWRNDADETSEWVKGKIDANAMVYRNDGLVVMFNKRLARQELDVDVWQIYVAGKKPSKLAGSDDKKISVTLTES